MQFPCVFTRSLSGGSGSLGGDATPSGAPVKQYDNVFSTRTSNVNGWPVHRLAVAFNGPTNITAARVLFYEAATQLWFQVEADKGLNSGKVTFFDCIAVSEPPPVGLTNLQNTTDGSIYAFLQVDKPAMASDGTYTFAIAGDLSTPT